MDDQKSRDYAAYIEAEKMCIHATVAAEAVNPKFCKFHEGRKREGVNRSDELLALGETFYLKWPIEELEKLLAGELSDRLELINEVTGLSPESALHIARCALYSRRVDYIEQARKRLDCSIEEYAFFLGIDETLLREYLGYEKPMPRVICYCAGYLDSVVNSGESTHAAGENLDALIESIGATFEDLDQLINGIAELSDQIRRDELVKCIIARLMKSMNLLNELATREKISDEIAEVGRESFNWERFYRID